jgi:prepilin-type N-terminal cleavage/methylation domain-containing protein/prepilin-type processing-associated H-X9-DG protein
MISRNCLSLIEHQGANMNASKRILHRGRSAFTLVELLVVITIIGILIALLLPAVQIAREAARKMQCANNFKQVGVALHTHHAAKGSFPVGAYDMHRVTPSTIKIWSWSSYILPYMDQQAVYDTFDFNQADYWTGESNQRATGTLISSYMCPSDPQYGERVWVSGSTPLPQAGMSDMCGVMDSTYAYETGFWPRLFPEVDSIMGAVGTCKIDDIKDGTSSTLAVGEVTGKGQGTKIGAFWTADNLLSTKDGINGPFTVPGGEYPPNIAGIYQTGFASYHPGGCNFVLADGSVAFLSQEIAQNILAALTTRDGPSPSNVSKYSVLSTEPLISGPP